jgi:hypothetical protein
MTIAAMRLCVLSSLILLGSGGLAPLSARAAQPSIQLLDRAEALPLSIDPAFEFRKTKLFFLENERTLGVANDAQEPTLSFERKRLLFGAITPTDIRNRYGNYFTFFWRARRAANLTVRLEYRQQKLGSYLQAREVEYPDAQGSHKTDFSIIGDDYLQQGRVTAWRVLLIENHRTVVGLAQSYLWR